MKLLKTINIYFYRQKSSFCVPTLKKNTFDIDTNDIVAS